MKRRNLTPEKKTERVKRERDPIPWRYCLLTLVCGLLLVLGFFWAARQHFSAMDLGIKNAKLRQQKESLEAEARRLYLSKEISLSPGEIKKAAKKIGLQDFTAQSIEIFRPNRETKPELDNAPKQTAIAQVKNETEGNLKKIKNIGLVEKAKDGTIKAQTFSVLNTRPQIAKK